MLPPAGPLRRLAWGTLVSSVGNGAWYTSFALFLTRSVGLAPAEVGVGLTVAGVLAIVAATPLGHLADRLGAREVYAALLATQAAASAAYVTVHSFAAFLAVASLAAIGGTGGGARNALVVGLAGEDDRVAALGALRSTSHLGWALGATAGAVGIGLDTRTAYLALVAVNAGSYLAYAGLVLGVPRVPCAPRAGRRGVALRVVRDGPYVTLAGLTGALALCWGMLSTGVPLWVVLHTSAPRSVSAVIVVINSLAIAALQVRFTRGSEAPRAAARRAMWSGAALALSCVLFAATDGGSGAPVVVVLLAAGAVHVVGELLFVAASWGLSVPLMPAGAPGEYQGMFAAGEATAVTAAPTLMTALVAGWGQPGWLVLAALFLVVAAAVAPATRWALRTRTTAAAAAS